MMLSTWCRRHAACLIRPHVSAELWHVWGPFAADMFARERSAQWDPGTGRRLPFWALWGEKAAVGIEALAADWAGQGGLCYGLPPVPIVGNVLRLLYQ